MVVVSPPRAGLRIAAAPNAHVHDVNGGMARVARGGVPGEQLAQGPFFNLPAAQGGVEAAPAAPVGASQAQVDRRRNRAGGKQGVGQLEERVGSAVETPVERLSESAQAV